MRREQWLHTGTLSIEQFNIIAQAIMQVTDILRHTNRNVDVMEMATVTMFRNPDSDSVSVEACFVAKSKHNVKFNGNVFEMHF